MGVIAVLVGKAAIYAKNGVSQNTCWIHGYGYGEAHTKSF